MQHVGLIGHCLRLSLWQVWAERKRSGAGQNSGGVERSGERVSEKLGRAWAGAAEWERIGERRSEKSGLMRSGKTFCSAPLRSLTCFGHWWCHIPVCKLMPLRTNTYHNTVHCISSLILLVWCYVKCLIDWLIDWLTCYLLYMQF